EPTELAARSVAHAERAVPAMLIEQPRREPLGLRGAKDGGPARSERDADAAPRAVDHERERRDRDDHRVAGAYLQERLRWPGIVPFRRGDEPVTAHHTPFGSGHEVGQRPTSLPIRRTER